jgi:hypothetical protein
VNPLAVALLLAADGSAQPGGSWAFAFRLGAVLVLAVAVAVLLVGKLAAAVDASRARRAEARRAADAEADER